MVEVEAQIQQMVDRETHAWDERDVEALLDLFHPDMVWPWPPSSDRHDPVEWGFVLGRYDRQRWGRLWQELFDTHALVHNRRETIAIVPTDQGDGAFAVVDVDTLWRNDSGQDFNWLGRACKVYTKVEDRWLMLFQTGLLDYSGLVAESIDGDGAAS